METGPPRVGKYGVDVDALERVGIPAIQEAVAAGRLVVVDLGAARERVRVARALGSLPALAAALARGEVSYSKVRAVTRVATPETEARLLAVARAGTAAHVERIVRGWRRVDRLAEAEESVKRHASRSLHVYTGEDGIVVLRGRLVLFVNWLVKPFSMALLGWLFLSTSSWW